MLDNGIGRRLVTGKPLGMKVPENAFEQSKPCSLIAMLMIDRMLPKTLLIVSLAI